MSLRCASGLSRSRRCSRDDVLLQRDHRRRRRAPRRAGGRRRAPRARARAARRSRGTAPRGWRRAARRGPASGRSRMPASALASRVASTTCAADASSPSARSSRAARASQRGDRHARPASKSWSYQAGESTPGAVAALARQQPVGPRHPRRRDLHLRQALQRALVGRGRAGLDQRGRVPRAAHDRDVRRAALQPPRGSPGACTPRAAPRAGPRPGRPRAARAIASVTASNAGSRRWDSTTSSHQRSGSPWPAISASAPSGSARTRCARPALARGGHLVRRRAGRRSAPGPRARSA